MDQAIQRDMLARVGDDLRRLGEMLEAVHERQRLVARAAAPSVGPVAVRDVVDRALAMLDLRDHHVVVEGDVTARVDAFVLERVVANLVDNAFRHSPAGTTVHVWLGRSADDGAVCISVEDEGDGVPEPDRARVFEPLFHRGPGTGMGLAIVHDLVDSLDGYVWVEDASGGGAAFRLAVPEAPEVDGPATRA